MPTLTIGDRTARLPIVQGGMAVRISLSPLATAVANAGGIGIIAGSGLSLDELASRVLRESDVTSLVVQASVLGECDGAVVIAVDGEGGRKRFV